jgi:Putative transposase
LLAIPNTSARLGFLAVLHTWSQTLRHHPHLHCVVPGGGLSLDGTRWVSCRPHFFLPVKVLARLFRRLFLQGLQQAFAKGQLHFHGSLTYLAQPTAFTRLLRSLFARDWWVYAKPPFAGPALVLAYLGRYTHRVAISNQRLLACDEGNVTFSWKDYAQGHQQRTMTLQADEFMRRFLLHVLPRGFQRLRQFGLLANRHRRHKLQRCRALLTRQDAAPPVPRPSGLVLAPPPDALRCPVCHSGTMHCLAQLVPSISLLRVPPPVPLTLDSS